MTQAFFADRLSREDCTRKTKEQKRRVLPLLTGVDLNQTRAKMSSTRSCNSSAYIPAARALYFEPASFRSTFSEPRAALGSGPSGTATDQPPSQVRSS
uniref:Uncharacterized protein n=1 Tax=Hyaloperonospora arabidopsidis (strain Emoy2) TaxID=559515 RepID=M4C0Q6_HYAAE